MAQPHLSRRRVILLTAAAVGLGGGRKAAAASSTTWRGEALGAEAQITIRGDKAAAEAALKDALAEISAVTAQFNLYDPESALGRLNDRKTLHAPSEMFQSLCQAVDHVHRATGGLFDPTVQRLWNQQQLTGAPGWAQIARSKDLITLKPGLALTFNGIAQGYATDRVAECLAARGFGETLVNLGESRGSGGPWRLGLADPQAGFLGTRSLRQGAIATSSPGALSLAGGITHIVNPHDPARAPLWSTVSVEAETATLADGFSTGFCHASRGKIQKILNNQPGLRKVTLVDAQGDITTLG
ncbi:MAG: FAD:protein FMN transferase [Mangrovicoccus sp.]|nr:FAD:protein FMN transferase [Mangrovicoccus sp.]